MTGNRRILALLATTCIAVSGFGCAGLPGGGGGALQAIWDARQSGAPVDRLIPYLSAEEPGVRVSAIQAIAATRDPAAAPAPPRICGLRRT